MIFVQDHNHVSRLKHNVYQIDFHPHFDIMLAVLLVMPYLLVTRWQWLLLGKLLRKLHPWLLLLQRLWCRLSARVQHLLCLPQVYMSQTIRFC